MEDEEFYSDEEVQDLIDEFKEMVDEDSYHFMDADDLEMVATELIGRFDFHYADAAIEHGSNLYPNAFSFKILKVKRLMMGLELEQAGKELKMLEEEYPPTAELYMEKAFYLKMSATEEDALPYIEKAYELTPEDPDINFVLGSEYIRLADYERGFSMVSFALENEESIEEQLFTLSYVFEDGQKFDEAVDFYTKLTDRFPLSKAAWFGLGLSWCWKKEYEQAIDAYLNVISLDEEASTAYFNIGNAYYEMHDYETAMSYYKDTYRIDNQDHHAVTGIADCLYQLNLIDDALQFYHKALDMMPDNGDAVMGIVSILKETGRDDEAEVFIRKAFEHNPQTFDMMFNVLPFFSDETQLDKLKEFFHLSFSKLTSKEDFMTVFTIYCACKPEYRQMGIEVLEEYLDNVDVAKVVPYDLAALHYLSGNHTIASNYLKTALLINYAGHALFLSIHPDLMTYPDIQRLIEIYGPKTVE